jgi:hypothetical protein
VPLLPEYVESITDDEVIFRNYAGERYVYKQPLQPVSVPGCGTDIAASSGTDVVSIRRAKRGTGERRAKGKRKAGGT